MIKKLSFLLFLSLTPFSFSKVILWDLGGVLFHPDKIGVAKDIGLSNFVTYSLSDWKTPNIQSLLFNILEYMEIPANTPKLDLGKEREKAGTGEGVALPTIMCHWQAGTVPGPEIIKQFDSHIQELEAINFFESKKQKRLIQKTVQAMFDPATLARNVRPIKDGMKLLQECVAARNKDGSKKNRIIAFSNWDHLSFDIFLDHNRGLFKDFEHIIISGHIKLIKPHAAAYKHVLKFVKHHYNLDAHDCILIDDQKVNAEGAERCGIRSLLVINGDYKPIRAALAQQGAL